MRPGRSAGIASGVSGSRTSRSAQSASGPAQLMTSTPRPDRLDDTVDRGRVHADDERLLRAVFEPVAAEHCPFAPCATMRTEGCWTRWLGGLG